MTLFFFVYIVLSSQRIDCLVISGLSQQLLLVFDWQRPKNLQNGGLILPGLTAAGIRHSCSLLLTPLHCAFLCKCGTRTGMGFMRRAVWGGSAFWSHVRCFCFEAWMDALKNIKNMWYVRCKNASFVRWTPPHIHNDITKLSLMPQIPPSTNP